MGKLGKSLMLAIRPEPTRSALADSPHFSLRIVALHIILPLSISPLTGNCAHALFFIAEAMPLGLGCRIDPSQPAGPSSRLGLS
jgi:hypothetical protein